MVSLTKKLAGDEQAGRDYVEERLSHFPRESIFYPLARYYLLPGNEGAVTQAIQAEERNIPNGQAYYYLGAQLELIDRPETARATFLAAEDALSPGMMERRLATYHLRAYRQEEGENR